MDKGVDETMAKFIGSMLNYQVITATLNNDSVTIKATKGCPQGGILVMYYLLQLLDQAGFKTLAYADDLEVMVKGKFYNIISERSQVALNIKMKTCMETDPP